MDQATDFFFFFQYKYLYLVANLYTNSSTLLLDFVFNLITMLKLINARINCLQFRPILIFFIHLEMHAYEINPMNYKSEVSVKRFQT